MAYHSNGAVPEARRRIALYSHDTVGLGHCRRNLAIASALIAGPVPVDVLLITGSRELTAFAVPPGIDCVVLPGLAKRDGAYGARTLGASLAEMIALRASIIDATLAIFDPDVLIVDKVARGACGELVPALRHLRAGGHTRVVLGLRDVLDTPPVAIREWRVSRTTEAVVELYDAVWVYGDKPLYDLVTEYHLPPAVADLVTFTGYLGHGRPRVQPRDPAAAASLPEPPYALCLVGGGQDGVVVAEAFAAARLPDGTRGLIVTGPYMKDGDRDRVRARVADHPGMAMVDFVDDCEGLVAGAQAIVTMGGYNTICEVLAAGKRPLVVPRVHPRTEQLVRAERLEARGLVDVCHPDAVTAEVLGAWLAGGGGTEPPSGPSVDLNGLARITDLVEQLLGSGPQQRALCHASV